MKIERYIISILIYHNLTAHSVTVEKCYVTILQNTYDLRHKMNSSSRDIAIYRSIAIPGNILVASL